MAGYQSAPALSIASDTTLQITQIPGPGQSDDGGLKGKKNKDAGEEAVALLAKLSAEIAAGTCDSSKTSTPIELDLFDKKLGADGMEQLVSALTSETSCTVEVLRVSNNKLGNTGVAHLGKIIESGSPPLTSLDLRMNRINEHGAEHLGVALRSNKSLRTLHVDSNDFQANGAAWIASALEVNSTLMTLSLDYNTIRDKGAELIALALHKNQTLSTLRLRANEIEKHGAVCIAQALATNSSLTCLDLSTNCITDEGAESFIEVLKTNRSLKELSLFGCELDPQTTAEVNAALRQNDNA